MEYSINSFAKMAGVSARTLRYYEEIGILMPLRKTEAGYRIYSSRQADTLQQILLYRELGLELLQIKEILASPDFDKISALESHLENLYHQKTRTEKMIEMVEQSIKYAKGETEMKDTEKFAALKKNLVNENEKRYGKEIRAKYGDAIVDASNEKFMGMTQETWSSTEELNGLLNITLAAAVKEGNPAGETAQNACALHQKWIQRYWDFYSEEAHLGLCEMYTQDERFREYYEKIAPGCAEFLLEAIRIYLK